MLAIKANLSAGLRAPAPKQQMLTRPRVSVMCPATKLYVGNLSWDTQEDDLAQLFGKYGAVQDVYVPLDRETGRRRGFGFVTMEENEAALAAIESTNEVEFMGRNIRVNEALAPNTDREGGRGGYRGGRGGGGRGGGDREGGRGYGRGYQRREEGGGGEFRGGRGSYGGGRGGRGAGYARREEGGGDE